MNTNAPGLAPLQYTFVILSQWSFVFCKTGDERTLPHTAMSIKFIEVPESIMQMIQPCYKMIIKITKSNNIYLAKIITVSFLNNSIK